MFMGRISSSIVSLHRCNKLLQDPKSGTANALLTDISCSKTAAYKPEQHHYTMIRAQHNSLVIKTGIVQTCATANRTGMINTLSVCTLCLRKKRHPFYFCDNLDVIHFCQFLAETYPREFVTNHIFRARHTSLYVFAPYVVKTSNDFYGIQYSDVSSSISAEGLGE